MNAQKGFSRFIEVAPGRKTTNEHLPVFFPNIEERTGIHSRNIALSSDTVESMALEAARRLFEELNIKGTDCGGLVLSTSSRNENARGEVTALAKRLGMQVGIRDGRYAGVNYACSGFPAAVEAGLALAEETDRHILVITSEIMSRLVDWSDESTAVLFADRAAATSIIAGGHVILDAKAWEVDDEAGLIHLERKTSALDTQCEQHERMCIRMNGHPLYRAAPGTMATLLRDSMQRCTLQPSDIVAVVPHQANSRFMEKIQKILMKDDADAWRHLWMVNQIDVMGNVGSSSIPCALAQLQDYFMPGKVVVCPAMGAGCDFEENKLTEGVLTFRMSMDSEDAL
jgi:3-oxoacyl-[acyl-carrier-protein] synthase-3